MLTIKYQDLTDAKILKYLALVPAIMELNLNIVVEENDQQHEFYTQEDFRKFLQDRGLIANEQI